MTKIVLLILLNIFCGILPVQCFQSQLLPVQFGKTIRSKKVILAANEKEDFLPETSFGAEVVPDGQRPVNEYLDMRRAPFFDWASNEVGENGLLLRLLTLYSVFFVAVCYPISGATFTQEGYLLLKLAASNVGALGVVLVVLVRLYSGWGYVGSRLKSKVIEYEETGT